MAWLQRHKLGFPAESPPPPATSERSYGLHILAGPGHDMAGATDVVAIHGLNGHFFKTWTHAATGFNWLRDAVPEALPKTRVMSFSYNSALQFSKSTLDIFDFADQLLECLLLERQSDNEKHRPVVFICHSLGGILFKQAMVRAFERERYTPLLKNTTGVMFLGTPHRGSPHANWATILGRILKCAAFGTSTNTQLSKDLEPKSRTLEQISRSFLERTDDISIFSFYETCKMEFMNSMVVDKDSACLGVRKETPIPLNGSHRTICRFSGKLDGDLRIILGNLAALHVGSHSHGVRSSPDPHTIRETRPPQLNHEEEALLSHLETSSPEAHKARNPSPVKGTCRWLLRHPTYQSWYSSPHSSFLWLSADPGCGKSVLASFLIDHYENQPPSERPNVCYFFFKSDNPEQADGTHALQAVLRQLFIHCRGLIKPALPSLKKNRLNSLESLWNAYVAAAEHPDAKDTICILDGLDECDVGSRRNLASLISKHFSHISPRAASESPSKLKLVVASRPDIAFKLVFERLIPQSEPQVPGESESSGTQVSMIRLRGEDEINAITDDVTMVIKSDISDLEYQGLPLEILKVIEEELIARADRTFLWVSLILQLLKEKVEAGATRSELIELLKSRDIDVIYNGLLSGRADAPGARKLLNLVLGAYRPLTVEELSIALATRERLSTAHAIREMDANRNAIAWRGCLRSSHSANFDDIENGLVFPYENYIKSLCGHFVRVVRNRVYLVHQTAREFLLARRRRPDPMSDSITWKGSFHMKEAHATIMDICATFLDCLGREAGCAVRGHASHRTAVFLEYAATCWPRHFRETTDGIRLDRNLTHHYHNLCHPRFPGFNVWIPLAVGVSLDILLQNNNVLSPDNLQDYYVDTLLKNKREPGVDLGLSEMAYSSNPGALSNHNFPLRTNRRGEVLLDFSKGPQNKVKRKKRQAEKPPSY